MNILLFLFFWTAAVAMASFCDDNSEFTLTWRDEFEGSALNMTTWTVLNGSDPIGGSCRSAYCDAANVWVKDGTLVLASRRNHTFPGHNYTTGAVNSRNKASWWPNTTFRLCVRAMLPGAETPTGAAQGVWPAHWMMPNVPNCDPDLGEMDILEMINGNGQAYGTYHWQTTYPKKPCAYPDGHLQLSNYTTLRAGWNRTFHEFSVERGPEHLAFVVDGNVIVNTTGADPRPLFWSVPWYMILNTAIGGPWPGEPTEATVMPIYHTIDYVRVATKAK